jgi:membrane protein
MALHHAIKQTWSEQLAQLMQTLQSWPWLETLQTLRQRFREDRLGLTASSLTFTTLIALVPLATVTLALFSAFPMFARFQVALETYFVESLIPDTIAKPVLATLNQFAAKSTQLGGVGLVLLVLTAIALLLTIDRALNEIWRVRIRRPFAQRVLVYWAAATLGPLVLGFSLNLTALAISGPRGLGGSLPGAVNVLINIVQFALLAGAMAALFRYVPNTHVRWRHALAGGVFVAAGFEVAKQLLGWYVAQAPGYALVYGAFATLPIFLLWLYCGWVIVLLGAVIAAYAPSLQMRVVRRPTTPGHRFTLALTLLAELARERAAGQGGASGVALAETLRTDPLQIEPLLDTLIEMGWAGRLEEEGEQRFVLIVDPATTKAAPLLERLLIERTASAGALWRHARLQQLTLAELLES